MLYSFLRLDAYSNNTTLGEAANFAFFYGTIPTAPSVYVFAKQYNIAAEQISAAIVVAQVASAPLMILTNLLIVQTTTSNQVNGPNALIFS